MFDNARNAGGLGDIIATLSFVVQSGINQRRYASNQFNSLRWQAHKKVQRPLKIFSKNFSLSYLAGIVTKHEVPGKYDEGELPLRAELFGVVQMEQHGILLARSHQIKPGKARDLLLGRLADNENVLNGACNLLTVALKEGRQISPAAEWLLDNYYLIEDQIRTAKRHLPKGYSKELPRLTGAAAHPRVYDLALQTISHGDGRIDPEGLSRFIAAYQQVTPLTLGELWAIPIMLRLALIENLRRVAARLVANRINANLADYWADQMVDTVEKDPSTLILLVADMARSDPPMVGAFVAELARRLQGQGPALSLPLTWIAPRLSEIGLTVEQLIQIEGQQKAADQVSISNSIGSLRLLGKMDWREFVETMSSVETVLLRDPTDAYRSMDFATRDRYRHVIEQISRRSKLSEVEVAEHAIFLAEQSALSHGHADHSAHVGYFLIDAGLAQLELAIPMTFTAYEAVCRSCRKAPLLSYIGGIILLGIVILGAIASKVVAESVPDWQLILLTALSLLGVSQLASSLVNWIVTIVVTPHQLPRMDFSEGISPGCKTLVTIPTMLSSMKGVESLCEALEVRFLANQDHHISYSLLTDFIDAATEATESDASLLALARQSIAQLNEKYRVAGIDKFFLFHRARSWNAQEKIWMGYERKRGKLACLNGFLRQDPTHSFDTVVGDTAQLTGIKYVITLDTDTQLPRESARQLIATIAHPLNQARFDADLRRVTAGYGILQPRVSSSLPPSNASLYQRLCSGDTGIDPYTRAISDVYQDVFGEGSFIGKGIYDIDAFEQALAGKFSDNQILSHDLLEGCYARSGLISDVHVFEDYPKRYSNDVQRRHRWIRGDWQLLGWLLPQSLKAKPELASKKNPLSILSRWKLFDNLRRSLVSTSLVLLLGCAWFLSPAPWFWSCVVLGLLLIPPLIISLHDLMRKSNDILVLQHLNTSLRSFRQHLFHAGLTLIFLPYDAWYSMDAILRALWRMTISRRRLLEWVPSNQDAEPSHPLAGALKTMWFAPLLAIVLATLLFRLHPLALYAAVPFLLAWLTAPGIAWLISEPRVRHQAQLEEDQTVFLYKLARKIFSYYEVLVTDADNWLPPDNIQERPVAVTAHRTSPTNIGLTLLANLSAYDFGFISLSTLLERSGNTLTTMARMERHRGHFYNWYDTESLQPLMPMYISTVDSGNLAGHLLTLRPGLLMLVKQPIVNPRMISGIADTYRVFKSLAGASSQAELLQFQSLLDEVHTLDSLSKCHAVLQKLSVSAKELESVYADSGSDQLTWWVRALASQCRSMYDELIYLAPWSGLINALQPHELFAGIDAIPTLQQLAELETVWLAQKDHSAQAVGSEEISGLDTMLALGSQRAVETIHELEKQARLAEEFAQMDFTFLYDRSTHLMTIGYAVAEQRCDSSFYDLLASEVRLCTFVMIAQGQLPQESWFALGRQLTVAGGDPILLSWSGSMFEYLMPLLVMPTFDNTLLDQTYHSVVQRQIDYGAQRDVPWGISESSYYTFDANLNYQYRAFGVPGLGLKRGLGDDLVVAPYASMMALMVDPKAACDNLQRLAKDGFDGKFGLYEAIDYTSSRLPRGQSHALIQSFMAHHQGMGLLALEYYLLDKPMQKRFESDPLFQATILLLQEKIPKASAYYSNTVELADVRSDIDESAMPMRIISRHDTRVPEVQLLSNGRYNLMISNSGGNSTRWKDLALTRWREDGTADNYGAFCYIRDCTANRFWSTTYQPTMAAPDSYEVIFSEGRAEFRRRDDGIEMHTEIVVSPEDDIEMRRTHITNRSNSRRTIEITSYAEIVLARPADEAAHPAFSNLFVQTEIMAQQNAILCSRRPRSSDEEIPCMFTLMVAHGEVISEITFETDRAKFLGRGNTTASPDAMRTGGKLSGSQGSVLDPIAAIRFQIELEPQQTADVDFVIGAAENRDEAVQLIAKYQDRFLADRVFELAWTHSQVVLRQLNASEADAQLFARLAGSVIYLNDQLRAEASILLKNRRGQSGLWSYAISGDLPIVLVQIRDMENIDLVRQMVQAHSYWRLKGLAVDLVIWNEDHAGYRQVMQEQIMGMIASGIEAHSIDRPGGIFVRLADQMSIEDRVLLQSVARVVICDSRGSLADQLNRRGTPELRMPLLIASQPRVIVDDAAPPPSDLQMFNGLGGFTPDGREYIVTTSKDHTTPAPWVNVLANPLFGTVISESGQAYTWGENAHEFRLTPWKNDAVSDSSGEAFYLRDENSGHFWSPTPLPCRGTGNYTTRHGHGYSVLEHSEDGIHSELWVYVALDASIKYSVLKVRNDSGEERKISATGYVEWVLGDLQSKSAMHIVTESDPVSGAIFAHNAYNTEFADRIAFFDVDAVNKTVCASRLEFLGRNSSLANPAAMHRSRLSGRVGPALDPCAAIQVQLELAAGQEREVVFMLGVAGRRSADVSSLVHRYRGSTAASKALQDVQAYWLQTLGAVQIETPDPAVDLLANGWLMYQTIACRLWARSGFYQSGGAFGFRDQLQDVMAMIHTEPHLTRAHILLSASHQFIEGDVMHWWHPPMDRGVRTHCSDDYLWLPLATCRYVQSVGDTGILDESIRYLDGRALNVDEDSYYDLPTVSGTSGSLYEHCKRAITHGLRMGVHGLPLIGSCDWNDGMDKVGSGGKGESVWLGFFLYDVLIQFSGVASSYGDTVFAASCISEANQLQKNIEANGWDGNWYRRAYFDDGTPLGSSENQECQIDSLSQSWAVLSGAGDQARTVTAMQQVAERLVQHDSGLIQLLEPPFDKSSLNPGYIKGYVPGVRENGGQYTHAAIWTIMAFAKMGDRERAWELMQMINPINHSRTAEQAAVYKVEPYVLAADVYAVSPHNGRGGWTWYTGSAGWMYRLITESLLGLHLEVDQLTVNPCIPADWKSFVIIYRYRSSSYRIVLSQAEQASMTVDGIAQRDGVIHLLDDGRTHQVEMSLARVV